MDKVNTFDIQKHVKSGETYGTFVRGPAEAVYCNNGLVLSIQASRVHYSLPKTDEGPYTHFEIGYPTMDLSLLDPYADEGSDVYGYVPLEVVEKILENAGGVYKVATWSD